MQEVGEVLGLLDADMFRFTSRYDASGSPTLTIPCGLSDEGLPHTIQFVGRHFDEARLCRIGHAYEQETDWHRRHPPA